MAEYDGKRAILTGDARGDKVLNGLDQKRLLKQGRLHVDLLKLPHHGSQNNVAPEFFERLTADRYVVSGDHEKFPNPHEQALRAKRKQTGIPWEIRMGCSIKERS
jgi:beta-lactamase superfamily II metal-dependent hydrolase